MARAGGSERKETVHLTEWSKMVPQKKQNESGAWVRNYSLTQSKNGQGWLGHKPQASDWPHNW